MTSNDISQLPPELTRSGRLDALWYFGIPNKEERKSIFKIHLDKTNKHYDKRIIDQIADRTDQYTGAEIKNIVKKSIWNSYQRFLEDDHDAITLEDLENAKKEIVPIINTYKEKINYLEQWAKTRAKNASKNETNVQKVRTNILKV